MPLKNIQISLPANDAAKAAARAEIGASASLAGVSDVPGLQAALNALAAEFAAYAALNGNSSQSFSAYNLTASNGFHSVGVASFDSSIVYGPSGGYGITSDGSATFLGVDLATNLTLSGGGAIYLGNSSSPYFLNALGDASVGQLYLGGMGSPYYIDQSGVASFAGIQIAGGGVNTIHGETDFYDAVYFGYGASGGVYYIQVDGSTNLGNVSALSLQGAGENITVRGSNLSDRTPYSSGGYSNSVTATTSLVVSIPDYGTTEYRIQITATSALAAAPCYVSAKTTGSFTLTFLSSITGTVTFDWDVSP